LKSKTPAWGRIQAGVKIAANPGKGKARMKVTPIHAAAQDPAINTLKLFHGDRFWQIIAIRRDPHDIVAASFAADSSGEDAARAFGAKWNDLGYDIYFPINPLKKALAKKAARVDVLEARWVWAECDPPNDARGVTLEGWRASELASIKRGREGVPPHTMIVDSGRGFWVFWRLRSPVALNGGEGSSVDEVESRVKGVGLAFGGDSVVYDTCRIARLPGFVNHKTKVVARVIEHFSDRDCDLAQFPIVATRERAVRAPGASIATCYIDDEAAVEAASAYLLSDAAPRASEGSRHKSALTVLQRCLDFGCSLDRAKDLALELWSPRCSAPPSDSTWDKMRALPRENLIGCDHPQARIDGYLEKPYNVEPPAGAPNPASSGFKTYAEICEAFNSSSDEFLIAGLMPAIGVGLMFGDSMTYKSFIALSQSLAIANGVDWAGRKTMSGAAFYIAAEGGAGVIKRIVGAQRAGGFDDAPIFLRTVTLNLGAKSSQDAALIIRQIGEHGRRPLIVVIDTAAASMGGEDENTQGMATLLLNAKKISDFYSSFVLIIHHCGLSAKDRGRGWSGQEGNADYLVNVSRGAGALSSRLDLRKLKDEDPDLAFEIGLRKVEVLKVDADGEINASATTLVVESVVQVPKEDFAAREAGLSGGAGLSEDDDAVTRKAREAREAREAEVLDEGPEEDGDVALLRLVAAQPGLTMRRYGEVSGKAPTSIHDRLSRLQTEKLVEKVMSKWRATAKGSRFLRDQVRVLAMHEREKKGFFD
jgi:hypothetical protein